VAKKLGYRPNAMARFLRSKRSHSVGVMFFDITDPFCTPVLRGIENALYQSSYIQIFADAHNQRNRFERYLEMLLEHHVEALIVVPTGSSWTSICLRTQQEKHYRGDHRLGDARELGQLGDGGHEAGGRLALEHLHQLGHRKIAFIRGPKLLIDSAPRWKGIQKFAHSAGLEIDPALVLQLPDSFDPTRASRAVTGSRKNCCSERKGSRALMASTT